MNRVKITFNKIAARNQTIDVTITREGKYFDKHPDLLKPTETVIYLKEPNPEIIIEIEADPQVNVKLGNALEHLLDRFEKIMLQQSKWTKIDQKTKQEAEDAINQAKTVKMNVIAREKVIKNIKTRL